MHVPKQALLLELTTCILDVHDHTWNSHADVHSFMNCFAYTRVQAKVQTVLEVRVRDLDVRALAGERDVITFKCDLIRASSLLKVRIVAVTSVCC